METKKNDDQVLEKTGDDSVLNMIHEIPVAEIYVNDQVRKTFDNEELAGLAQSIKENGLIQPITVSKYLGGTSKRIVDGKSYSYDLITGERRLRAHQLLKADTIRAMIQIFNKDGEILQVQIIENLQRVDLHPMEEAWGYNQLVEVNKLTRKQIAEKVGKSLSYIDKRVQLMKLIPEAQTAFRENNITVSHAIEIARLDLSLQKKVMDSIYHSYSKTYEDLEGTRMIISELMTDLSTAIFDRKDSELVKKVGACTGCNKNTSCYETLFDDLPKGKSYCTDKLCFNNKTKLFLAAKIAKAEEEGLPKISFDGGGKAVGVLYSGEYAIVKKDDKKCDNATKAILIKTGWSSDAGGQKQKGDKITICNDPNCKVHGKKVKEAARNAGPGDQNKHDEKNLKLFGDQLRKRIEDEKFNLDILKALAGQANEKSFGKFFDLIIAKWFNKLDRDITELFCDLWGLNKKEFLQGFRLPDLYKKIKNLKLSGKIEKIVQLLFAEELDPDRNSQNFMLLKFTEENFKGIKIPEIKKGIAAELEVMAVTDYKAEIKNSKTDLALANIAKRHLGEVVSILKESGIEKHPLYESKVIWDGKKLADDFYDLPAGKYLGLVQRVVNKNREAALKLHQLVMVIPEIKKCLGPKNN
jgi:ParB/RepB/Spo0J family partition protein